MILSDYQPNTSIKFDDNVITQTYWFWICATQYWQFRTETSRFNGLRATKTRLADKYYKLGCHIWQNGLCIYGWIWQHCLSIAIEFGILKWKSRPYVHNANWFSAIFHGSMQVGENHISPNCCDCWTTHLCWIPKRLKTTTKRMELRQRDQ